MRIKKLIICFLSVAFISGGAMYGYYSFQHPNINLDKSSVSIEYGTTTDKVNKSIKNNIETKGVKVENFFDEELIPVGNYKINISLRDTKSSFLVSVRDTTPPDLIVDSKSLNKTYDNGYVTENTFKEFSKAEDLSDCTIDVLLPEGFDNTVSGEYLCTIEAVDTYGNKSDVEVSFSIKDPLVDTGNKISISSVGITDAMIGVGDDQDDVNQYDVLLMNQFGTPGSGEPILMAGHNNRSFETLHNTKVGDIVEVSWNGADYKYKVIFSGICTTTGSDLSDKETGQDILEYSGREVLQMYTCYKIYADNERWVIKAEPING